MTLADPPDPPNPILNLIRKVFGDVQWKPPVWIPWTGRQFNDSVRWLRADLKRIVAAAVVLVAVAAGLAWYKLRPRPHYVEYTVTAPALTTYDDKGVPTIDTLKVEFTEPAAPLASLDKRLTSGIQISPTFAGKWNWLDDKHLQFTPAADWPVDASFRVKIARKGF